MKIKKNEFVKKHSVQKNLEELIERVINPFEPQITSRNLKVFIVKKRDFNFFIKNYLDFLKMATSNLKTSF